MEHITSLVKSLISSAVIYAFMNYITKLNQYFTDSRLVLIYWPLIAFFSSIVLRVILYPYIHRLISKAPFNTRRLLIVGDTQISEICALELKKHGEYGCEVVGFFSLDEEKGRQVEIRGFSFERAQDLIDRFSPTDLLVAVSGTSVKKAISVISGLSGSIVNIEFTSYQYERLSEFIDTERYGDIPVFSLGVSPYFFWYKSIKRFADVFFSSLFLLLSLPLTLTIWLLVKISSRGPGIISQPRVGLNGKRFRFYKFRTMKMPLGNEIKERDDAYIDSINRENSVMKKIVDKKRVTWIGKILRATALDEIPQFFNVLKNDMSLVGPRPCLESEYESYDAWHKKRYRIKPGCTGIWQVTKSKGLSFSDTILLDMIYCHSVSPWLDIQLVLNTLFIMITGSADK